MSRAQAVLSRPFLTLSTLLLISATVACGFFVSGSTTGSGCNNTNGEGGFTVHISTVNSSGIVIGEAAGGQAFGTFQKPFSGNPPPPLQGCVTSFGSASNYLPTPQPVAFGEAPAWWQGSEKTSCNGPPVTATWNAPLEVGDPINPNGGGPQNQIGTCNVASSNSFFGLTGSLPATFTVQGSGITTSSGMPRLSLFSIKADGAVSTTSATGVASDGTSATFNFPLNSSGAALGAGIYGYVLQNQIAPGKYADITGNVMSLGTSTTYNAPFGVDATKFISNTTSCSVVKTGLPPVCHGSHAFNIDPIVTLQNSAAVSYSGNNINVGTGPTAVKAYAYRSTTTGTAGGCGPNNAPCSSTTTNQASLALVANTGANSASIIGLPAGPAVATINVGVQPVAILIDNSEAFAYVANLGSGTVSQINLSTKAVTGTVNVGANPTSLALDPSGTAFWVGGLNYISKINTSGLSITTTYPVNGQVTSLSISSAQNSYVYTVINGSTFQGAHAVLTSGVPHMDYQIGIPQPTAQIQAQAASSGLPTWLQIGGPLVSASYANRYIVEGTPTGFVVLDLQSGTQLIQATTSSQVVGIAVDPSQGTVYATESAANTLLTIPLPPIQVD